MFWSANAGRDNPPPARFIDWDPAETARLRRERDAKLSLDDKIRAFFAGRASAE